MPGHPAPAHHSALPAATHQPQFFQPAPVAASTVKSTADQKSSASLQATDEVDQSCCCPFFR